MFALPPTRSEQNPKLFSSHRCSGYFSLQMSPPQTTGCGNFNLWRASTLQTGLPTRQRLNWRHWRWKSSQILFARGLQFSHVASFLYSRKWLFNPIVSCWRQWMHRVYWKNSVGDFVISFWQFSNCTCKYSICCDGFFLACSSREHTASKTCNRAFFLGDNQQ